MIRKKDSNSEHDVKVRYCWIILVPFDTDVKVVYCCIILVSFDNDVKSDTVVLFLYHSILLLRSNAAFLL
jgi:hypothetical protein